MRKPYLLTTLAIVFGLWGAFLRGKHLSTGFEAGTGLPVRSGNPFGLALLTLTIAVFLILLLLSFFWRKSIRNCSSPTLFRQEDSEQPTLRILSAFFMLLSAAAAISLFIETSSISLLIAAILSFLSGVSLISLTFAQKRGRLSAEHLICAAAPVFWVCYLLIYYYREHSANPVFGAFSYELFALAISMMAFFYFSGFFFDRPYPTRTFFMSYFAAYLVLAACGGRFYYNILSAQSNTAAESLIWFFALISILLLVLANAGLLRFEQHNK